MYCFKTMHFVTLDLSKGKFWWYCTTMADTDDWRLFICDVNNLTWSFPVLKIRNKWNIYWRVFDYLIHKYWPMWKWYFIQDELWVSSNILLLLVPFHKVVLGFFFLQLEWNKKKLSSYLVLILVDQWNKN